jgi:hypothetical protein
LNINLENNNNNLNNDKKKEEVNNSFEKIITNDSPTKVLANSVVANLSKKNLYSPTDSSKTELQSPTGTVKTEIQSSYGSPSKLNQLTSQTLLTPTTSKIQRPFNPLTAAYNINNLPSPSQSINIQNKIDDINEFV